MKIRAFLAAALLTWPLTARAEDAALRIVGSSTVFPFTAAVAEALGNQGGTKTPIVESTGTGAGFKLFCENRGKDAPDAVSASREIKPGEKEACSKSGLGEIFHIKIGFDGIVLAHSLEGTGMDITRRQLFLALAKDLPIKGKLTPNPYQKWSDIDPKLPNEAIKVYGPPPTSGTRDAFVELAMNAGCEGVDEVATLPETDKQRVCSTIREDGAFVEAGENDNLIVQRLKTNPQTFGVFGYAFLEENLDTLEAIKINGISPDFDTVSDASYPLSRSMFIYTSKKLLEQKPALRAFFREYISENAIGEDGYLLDKSLIPLPEEALKAQRETVQSVIK